MVLRVHIQLQEKPTEVQIHSMPTCRRQPTHVPAWIGWWPAQHHPSLRPLNTPRYCIAYIIFLPAMEPNRAHTISLSQLTPEERVLVCVEVTHAADTRLSAAVADKLEQHSSWMHYLVQQGWQVTCFPVAVSHSGLVTSTARAALERCGVAPRQAATAVRRLVSSALAYNVQIRTSRRSLYAQTPPTAQNPPDPA